MKRVTMESKSIVPDWFDATGFADFDDLDERQKRIIISELSAEPRYSMHSEDRLAKYLSFMVAFKFTRFVADKLPRSAWESSTKEKELSKIRDLEASILDRGYLDDKPPVLYQHFDLESMQFVSEYDSGNHRVQAVKNLVNHGSLPPSFSIPVVQMIPNSLAYDFDATYRAAADKKPPKPTMLIL